MTFLEYTCLALLGMPRHSRGNGEHYWPCPQCESPKFHTRPHKPPHKDKFSCFRCRFWGDAMDLLRCLYPAETPAEHARRWKMLREEWEALDPAEQLRPEGGGGFFPPGSRGRRRRPEGLGELHRAYEAMGGPAKYAVEAALRYAELHDVDLTALAEYTRDVEESRRASDELHRRTCEDPDCDADVCREARGLPPLSGEQKDQLREQAREERRRFDEEMRGYSPRYRRWARRDRNRRAKDAEAREEA